MLSGVFFNIDMIRRRFSPPREPAKTNQSSRLESGSFAKSENSCISQLKDITGFSLLESIKNIIK